MKKSLVALAVLAASGAAMAQVSITGNVTAGFQSNSAPNGVDYSGFGVDTAEVVFTATEDLGGGMKASAKLGLVDAARGKTAGRPNTGFGPGDSELSLSGGFGTLALSASRGVDYLSGGVAGVGGSYMDGRIFAPRVSTDKVSYSIPVGSFTVGLSYSERTDDLRLGYGTSGAPNTTGPNAPVLFGRQVVLEATYADGPLIANAGYLSDEAAPASEVKNHYRGALSYDLGVVKLGAGIESATFKDPGLKDRTGTNSLLAVSVPLGAVTLGANWAQFEYTDSETRTGYSLKASYAFSKRTSFIADYVNWKAAAADTSNTSQYNLFLSHSF